jgi:drug/metabolite transporter (DMT)-like permease
VAHKDLIIRALLGLTGLTMYVYALTHVHLGLASALNQSSPLFVALFAFLLLRERSSFWLFPLILLGFTGAMLIISPDFGGIDFNALVGLGSAVVAGLAYTWVRKLRKTDQPQTIVRWFSGTVTLAALPVVTIQGWVLPNAFESLLLLGLGVFSLSGQLGLTNAFRRGESAVVSPFIYISVLVSLVLGWAIWSEWPGPIALAGAVLLVTSSIGVAVIGARTPSVEA